MQKGIYPYQEFGFLYYICKVQKMLIESKKMDKTKICVIINPISGTESKKNIVHDIAGAFDQTKCDLVFRVTGFPNHATEFASPQYL